jgi:diadenosine tetraphosphatase ApaH/serine/threonine PP2A family protein phosphatase
MKYGVLGDIHSNLSALQAVLSELSSEGVSTLLSVGDVVGYGAAPRECLALLRESGVQVVKGNHDAATVGELSTLLFNAHARAAVEWTRSVLSEEELRWLAELPYLIELEHCAVGHGTYDHPELFDYVRTTADADASLDRMQVPVCFVGHTHVPVTLMRLNQDPNRTAYTRESYIELGDASRALVNVGSVGQPRDEDPRAAYAVFDTEAETVRIQRVEYDIDREAARIRAAGLASALADRLHLGL